MLDLSKPEEGVVTLTLNRPEALNALSTGLIQSLLQVLAQVRQDPAARVLLLTGQGRAFCAGADLHDPMMNLDCAAAERGRRFAESADSGVHALARAVRGLGKPIIAAVNGAAVGGGAALALAAHIVIAGDSAYFQLPFTARLGLVPDLGGSWHWMRRLGAGRALPTAMLGEKISAQQAAQWGLIWQNVPDSDLMATAYASAARLTAGAPRALAALPELMDQALCSDFETQLDHERDLQAKLVQTDDFQEAVTAFREKRPPRFVGR